jgi:hypothetical protein
MSYRRIRLANLRLELPDRVIREASAPYGEVKEVHEETWSKAYRYPVYNGIRVATTQLKHHLPSHMVIAGTRILVSYEGQPPTCYVCNAQGRQSNDCPRRKNTDVQPAGVVRHPWADMVTQGREIRVMEVPPTDQFNQSGQDMRPADVQDINKHTYEDPSTLVTNTKEDATMDIQALNEDNSRQGDTDQRGDREGKNDAPPVLGNLNAYNVMTLNDGLMVDPPAGNMGNTQDHRERGTGNGKSPIHREHKPDDTSLSEGVSLERPRATSLKRIKKSRLERDTHRQRGRTRSNTRATASTNAPPTQ